MEIIDNNQPFTLSYMRFNPDTYEIDLSSKVDKAIHDIGYNDLPSLEIIPSDKKHYRHRCRFAISLEGKISYVMWENGMPSVRVQSYPLGSVYINAAMDPLLRYLEDCSTLSQSLCAVHFLSTTLGDLSITLVYGAPLPNEWKPCAEEMFTKLSQELKRLENLSCNLVGIVGRSRKIKCVIGEEDVSEELTLSDGRSLLYKQVPDGFSNPNPVVNARALSWLCEVVGSISQLSANNEDSCDLLELYCGNGNHTVALAGFVRRIMAVEINRSLCRAAEENLTLNGVNNATVLACDSAKVAERILKRRKYVDDKSGEYDFGGVLVDPPRCGLDPVTRRLISNYPDIVYVSCNPEALGRDMKELLVTHDLKKIAIFDQFAYTPHLECAVHLSRRDTADGR